MKLVIDISEEDYDDILNGEIKSSALNWSTFNSIRNGTPLPKGHGKLIDANKLKTVMFCYMTDKSKTHTAKYVMSVARGMVDLQKTVVEADKERKDD